MAKKPIQLKAEETTEGKLLIEKDGLKIELALWEVQIVQVVMSQYIEKHDKLPF
jgi:hypothetical protein